MAHHAATKKSIRQTEKRTLANTKRKSLVRTCLKKVDMSIATGKKEDAKKNLSVAESQLARAVKRGLFSRGYLARSISKFSKKIKSLS